MKVTEQYFSLVHGQSTAIIQLQTITTAKQIPYPDFF